MKVLVACEFSGTVRDEFLKLGHDAYSCDILPTESIHPESKERHFQCDVFEVLKNHKFDLMIAHPPCTHLSVSGARWFPPYTKKGEAGFKPLSLRVEALDFVRRLMNVDIEKICIENPVSVISSHIRKSDQLINPFQFGHTEQKRTCLWLKNLPLLTETNNVYDEMMLLPLKVRTRIHWLGSGKGKERSKFYQGIAQAMAQQWGGEIDE